jgi:hypothetical protein
VEGRGCSLVWIALFLKVSGCLKKFMTADFGLSQQFNGNLSPVFCDGTIWKWTVLKTFWWVMLSPSSRLAVYLPSSMTCSVLSQVQGSQGL